MNLFAFKLWYSRSWTSICGENMQQILHIQDLPRWKEVLQNVLSFLIATCSSPKFHIDRRPLQVQCLTWGFAGAPAQKLMRSHWQRRTRRWASLDVKIMLDAHLKNHFNHFTSKCWAFPNFMYIVLVDIVDSDAIRCLAGVQACCLGWICHSNQCIHMLALQDPPWFVFLRAFILDPKWSQDLDTKQWYGKFIYILKRFRISIRQSFRHSGSQSRFTHLRATPTRVQHADSAVSVSMCSIAAFFFGWSSNRGRHSQNDSSWRRIE